MIKINDDEIVSLWKENKDKLEARIRKLTGRADLAEDLLQDVFVKVYPKAEQLDSSYTVKYLMRTASNVARDYLRQQYRWKTEYGVPEYSHETPYDTYLRKERENLYVHEVLPVLKSLPAKQQEAMNSYMSDTSRSDMARRTGIPYATLRSRQESALTNLKKRLGRKKH